MLEKIRKDKKKYKIPLLFIPWFVFGVLILLTSVLLLPTKVVKYQAEIPYETIEPYIAQVSYEVKEQYIESVPYTEEESYIDTESYIETVNTKDCDYNSGCTCTGKHWLWGYCVSCDCTRERSITQYRNVTKYKEVIKERTVTKYREETQYKTITKTRTETKQKEVNWLFGFDAIIKFRNLG